jgi:hypothetical protein
MNAGTKVHSGHRVVLAAVQGQHHVLGLRMVADVLEAAGYDVDYLGADVPGESLQGFIAAHQPSVVGLTSGISVDVPWLADSLGRSTRSRRRHGSCSAAARSRPRRRRRTAALHRRRDRRLGATRGHTRAGRG